MRKLTGWLLIFCYHFSMSAYADGSVALDLNCINVSKKTGILFLRSGAVTSEGPILSRNGGTDKWTFNTNDKTLFLVGFKYASGKELICHSDNGEGDLILNTKMSSGDAITITLNDDPKDLTGLKCTCLGTACDVGWRPA